jgi:hypothetical protein
LHVGEPDFIIEVLDTLSKTVAVLAPSPQETPPAAGRPPDDETAETAEGITPVQSRRWLMRGTPTLPILLALLLACGDGPTQLTAPVETGTAFTPSAEVVATVADLLDDAFVRELMDGARALTDLLDGAVQDVSHYATPGHILALSSALTVTRNSLVPSGDDAEKDADEVILRAALTLMLDDALTLLEEPPPMHSEETEGLGTDNTKPRSIER